MAFDNVASLFQDHPRRTVMMVPARTRALFEHDLLELHDSRDWWRRGHQRSRDGMQERNAWNCLLKCPCRPRQCNGEAEAGCNLRRSIHFSSSTTAVACEE